MDAFKKQDALKPYFEGAYAWAVFNSIAKVGIFFVGGATGKGEVYVNNKDGSGEKKIGDAQLFQLNGGWVLGGQVYSEIVFFESEKDLQHFTDGSFEFGADANVVGLTASAGVRATTMGNQGLTAGLTPDQAKIGDHVARYIKGMKVYTLVNGGLMYQATISGQKFTYTPLWALRLKNVLFISFGLFGVRSHV